MRGYFGIGLERISKPMNAGAIFRTAHAFGAAFVFTVAATYPKRIGHRADTSKTPAHVPYYEFPDIAHMVLPDGCKRIGVELTDDAVELPSFHHPGEAAYILGPERGSLSAEMVATCDHVIQIPTKFCVNVGIAAAIIMYDRIQSLGRFAPRPVTPGGPTEGLADHAHGGPKFRAEADAYLGQAPDETVFQDPD